MQHLQRAGMQSGGAEGCIAQERQRQSAASHKSVVHWQSRIASLARGSGGGPKFAQVCSWLNVPHFGQRACGSYHSRNSVCSDWTDTVVPEVER